MAGAGARPVDIIIIMCIQPLTIHIVPKQLFRKRMDVMMMHPDMIYTYYYFRFGYMGQMVNEYTDYICTLKYSIM